MLIQEEVTLGKNVDKFFVKKKSLLHAFSDGHSILSHSIHLLMYIKVKITEFYKVPEGNLTGHSTTLTTLN